MAAKDNTVMPIISKMYCSSSQAVLVVRRRPHVINGGGFVVTDCSQKVAFKVDGCGILGKKDEMILRDSDGDALLLFRRKGATVEALSLYRRWRGYGLDYEGSQDQMVFCLKEPNSCLARTRAIRISTKATKNKEWDFEIKGNFPDKDCCIVDSKGKTMAQIGVKKELMASEDLYHVVVTPGTDQAFVILRFSTTSMVNPPGVKFYTDSKEKLSLISDRNKMICDSAADESSIFCILEAANPLIFIFHGLFDG